MKTCDEKLKSCLIEAMKLDNARLEEEIKHCEPHIFSEEFEQRMEELLTVHKRKSKFQTCFRFIAAAVLVALLTGGILFMGSEDLHASNLSIDIQEWLDKFFVVRNGVDDRNESDVFFDQSQIGYIPEGFEEVYEHISFSITEYKYENELGNYIFINVQSGQISMQIDNEDIETEVHVNDAGYEYTQAHKNTGESYNSVMWLDENGIYYYITGTVEMSEVIKIMNSISY